MCVVAQFIAIRSHACTIDRGTGRDKSRNYAE